MQPGALHPCALPGSVKPPCQWAGCCCPCPVAVFVTAVLMASPHWHKLCPVWPALSMLFREWLDLECGPHGAMVQECTVLLSLRRNSGIQLTLLQCAPLVVCRLRLNQHSMQPGPYCLHFGSGRCCACTELQGASGAAGVKLLPLCGTHGLLRMRGEMVTTACHAVHKFKFKLLIKLNPTGVHMHYAAGDVRAREPCCKG